MGFAKIYLFCDSRSDMINYKCTTTTAKGNHSVARMMAIGKMKSELPSEIKIDRHGSVNC